MIFESFSPEDTTNLALMFAQEVKRGDILCLSGDLGAGKTLFTQGFAKGLGYEGHVTSPTFTLVNVYESTRFPIYHFDLYRLEGGTADLESIGYDDYFYGSGVCIIEWPERIENGALPEETIWIEINSNIERGSDYREIRVISI